MKKAILKRTADCFEKLAVGSMLVGLFQGKAVGLLLGRQLRLYRMGGKKMNIWLLFALVCAGIAAFGVWAGLKLKS